MVSSLFSLKSVFFQRCQLHKHFFHWSDKHDFFVKVTRQQRMKRVGKQVKKNFENLLKISHTTLKSQCSLQRCIVLDVLGVMGEICGTEHFKVSCETICFRLLEKHGHIHHFQNAWRWSVPRLNVLFSSCIMRR